MRKPLYEGTPTERELETSNTPVTPEAGQEQRRHQAQLQKHTHTTTRARAAHTSDDQNTPMKCANAPATHVHTTAHKIIRGVPVGGFKLHTPSNHTAGEAIKDMHAGNPLLSHLCALCHIHNTHTHKGGAAAGSRWKKGTLDARQRNGCWGERRAVGVAGVGTKGRKSGKRGSGW